MIRGLFLLLVFQLAGEVLARALVLPAPGPVVGLALLVVALGLYQRWRPFTEEALEASDLGRSARGLIGILPLLFVPAGVGVVQYLGLLRDQGVALAAALVVSTLTTPLFWLTATLAAYLVADLLAKAARRHPLVNPVAISIALIGVLLGLTGTDYQSYFNGAQFVHFLLGPATVALGIPIYANRALVVRNFWPMAAALVVGAIVAIVSAVLIAKTLGAPRTVLIALAPKSVTAGVAMAVTEALGGPAPLTGVLVIATGILGAVVVTPLMNALGVTDYAARGFAVGLASHGIGTARAFAVDPVAGVFAGLAMGLNAIVTPAVVPLLLPWHAG
jgi:putative effector of murein hydrolase